MQEKLFLINKSMAYPIERLKKIPVAELTVIADYVLEAFNSLAILANEGLINLADYHLIPAQVQEDEHYMRIGKQNDWLDIVINKELQLHISTTTGKCYNMDLYAYDEDVSDKNKNWDSDYISSISASYETIKKIITAREIE